MATTIADYPNVRERLNELGCNSPHGFVLLPTNFEAATSVAEFRQVVEATTVSKLLRSADVPQSEILPPERRPPCVQNNSWDWTAPVLFVAYEILSQNPDAIRIVIEQIGNYLVAFRPELGTGGNVKFDFVVERNKARSCKRVSYQGPIDGFRQLPQILEGLRDDE